MKLYFENAAELEAGIAILAPELGIVPVGREEAEKVVTVTSVAERMLCIEMKGSEAHVTYGGGYARFFRALSILAEAWRNGESALSVHQTPLFENNGAMVDMSRNAVMNLSSVKTMLRKMALMGMNCFQLYTEDTYTVEEYPYFGYMRGRYTKEELCELDRYALSLGIELVPCIQVLGHMGRYLQWPVASACKDTDMVLLAGADETYRLIDCMMKTVSECFTTRRVHIGMDETKAMGSGNYLRQNGYREPDEIYFEHLERVQEIARKYGLEPMMWSDMFFRMAGKGLKGFEDYDRRVEFSEAYLSRVPKGCTQVFWDYYHEDEDFYAINLDKHKMLFGDKVIFAGGVWLWSSHCPMYSESLRNSIPALEACRKKGVREVLATVWHNGSENAHMLALAGLAWYADYDYTGGFDLDSAKACFARATGVDYDDLMRCELPEHPHGERNPITRPLLYNDPLTGLFDKHFEGLELSSYYQKTAEELAKLPADLGVFTPAVEVIKRLCDVLIYKGDFGLRLKAAYDRGDREAMASMQEECDVIVQKLEDLCAAHRASWMTYNKPFGWEIHDLRYGGLMARFATAKTRIAAYLAGEIDKMEELEETRLRYDGKGEDAEPIGNRFFWYRYRSIVTTGIL